MAVIIKDIDVPESCRWCVFRESSYSKNDYCLALGSIPLPSKEHLTGDFKYPGCPIKSVDGLIDGLKQAYCPAKSDTYSNEWGEPVGETRYIEVDKMVRIIKEYCGVEEWEGNEDE